MRNYQRINTAFLKETILPLDFYLEELNIENINIKSNPWIDGGLCPFHSDNNPGSFKVNLETGAFKCHSCSQSGGDIIAFIQKRDGVSFLEALNFLKSKWEV